jgi:hypothetical protein
MYQISHDSVFQRFLVFSILMIIVFVIFCTHN